MKQLIFISVLGLLFLSPAHAQVKLKCNYIAGYNLCKDTSLMGKAACNAAKSGPQRTATALINSKDGVIEWREFDGGEPDPYNTHNWVIILNGKTAIGGIKIYKSGGGFQTIFLNKKTMQLKIQSMAAGNKSILTFEYGRNFQCTRPF